MSGSIPLVRASAVAPLELWLKANGWPADQTLFDAGLPASPSAAPDRLIPLHCFVHLLTSLAETVGPDLGVRMATPEAFQMLGGPAEISGSSRTLREALERIGRSFHFHASHVFFMTSTVPGGMLIHESIAVPGSPAAHHQAQQHVAGLINALVLLAFDEPLAARFQIAPHPDHGVEHLKPYLGEAVEACASNRMTVWIGDAVLDRELPWCGSQDLAERRHVGTTVCSTLTDSARLLIAGMIEDGNPSIDRLALFASRSRRTIQRQLAAEGTSYAALLDSVRHDMALAELRDGGDSIASIARTLGYGNPSSLTRAVRRWTDSNPRQVRKQGER